LEYNRELLSVGDAGDALISRYEAGFTACVAEVGRYLTSVDVVPQLSAVLPHLVNHLAGCLQRSRHRDTCYVTTQVPVEADEASVVRHRGHETKNDQHFHRLLRRQQSSDDLNCSFLQAISFNIYSNVSRLYLQRYIGYNYK